MRLHTNVSRNKLHEMLGRGEGGAPGGEYGINKSQYDISDC